MKGIIATALAAAVLSSPAHAKEKIENQNTVGFMQHGCTSAVLKKKSFDAQEGFCLGTVETMLLYEEAFKKSCYKKKANDLEAWSAIKKAIVFQAITDSKETDDIFVALINASRKLYPCPGT